MMLLAGLLGCGVAAAVSIVLGFDSTTAWIIAVISFFATEALGISAAISGRAVTRRQLFRWGAVIVIVAMVGSVVFFFLRAASNY
jgi:hypothetical protein